MSHVRQQIRDEVVQRLDATPRFAGRVQASRVYTTQAAPWGLVYTSVEEAVSDVMGVPSTSHREVTVTIEVYSKAGTDQFDADIDLICVEIEKSLADDGTKFLMCKTWEYRGISFEYSKEGERAAGIATLEYVFTYRINENDPEIGV